MALPAYAADPSVRLQISGLYKRLGSSVVVDGVDLAVQEGESIVILGPSGCGKTTTLRMVAGFIEPDAGEIVLAGRLASGHGTFVPTERRQLGMVFQSYAVWPHKSVFDNVVFSLAIKGVDRATARRKVERVLELVQLAGFERRYPGDLSGGQQQRVALARAIVAEPSLLLLDEPLSNLDAGLRQEMRSELKSLHRRTGVTTLYVTHDQEEALVLADRVAVMNQGRIEQLDTPEAIYRRPRSRFVASFVGTTNLIDAVVEAIDLQGGRLRVRSYVGLTFWAGAEQSHLAEAAVGDAVTVAVRPEDVAIVSPSGEADAKLVDASFLGSRYEIELAIGGRNLQAHARSLDVSADGRVGLKIGSAAWIIP